MKKPMLEQLQPLLILVHQQYLTRLLHRKYLLLSYTRVLAFRDINLQAPVHVILIPPEGLTELGKAEAQQRDILGKLLYAAKIVAEKEGILDGFPVVINSGPTACQSVYHLHLHVLGGRQMKWPPG